MNQFPLYLIAGLLCIRFPEVTQALATLWLGAVLWRLS